MPEQELQLWLKKLYPTKSHAHLSVHAGLRADRGLRLKTPQGAEAGKHPARPQEGTPWPGSGQALTGGGADKVRAASQEVVNTARGSWTDKKKMWHMPRRDSEERVH